MRLSYRNSHENYIIALIFPVKNISMQKLNYCAKNLADINLIGSKNKKLVIISKQIFFLKKVVGISRIIC